MKELEAFIVSFGFREEPFIIFILCIVVLLVNFMGGLFSNIILAMGGRPIVERSLFQRTSFRLAAASEFFFLCYIGYYHLVLTSGIALEQAIFWNFTVIAGPLLAMIGAQIGYLTQKKKIDKLKSKEYAIKVEQGSDEQESDEMDDDLDD